MNYDRIVKNKDNVAWPCGVIAKYLFNDKFNWIADTEGKGKFNVTIDDSNIAHSVDIDHKFKRNEAVYLRSGYWTDIEDPHLMVWYQMETLADFWKLYGSVDGIMRADHIYKIQIIDNFDSESIGNKKFIVLSELSTFGGKNEWLAYHFGIAAILILFILIFFFIMYFAKLHKRNRDNEAFINSLTY